MQTSRDPARRRRLNSIDIASPTTAQLQQATTATYGLSQNGDGHLRNTHICNTCPNDLVVGGWGLVEVIYFHFLFPPFPPYPYPMRILKSNRRSGTSGVKGVGLKLVGRPSG